MLPVHQDILHGQFVRGAVCERASQDEANCVDFVDDAATMKRHALQVHHQSQAANRPLPRLRLTR